MQNKSRGYYLFSKKERTGILVFSFISFLIILIPYWIPRKVMPDLETMTAEGQKWKALLANDSSDSKPMTVATHLFPFDPNKISVEEWQTLGVPAALAKRIINYRNKGGQFRKPDDLRKIWGMSVALANQLIPYIRTEYREPVFMPEKRVIQAIDINTANLEDWKSLPGIGNVLAEKIIKYRERSHGFGSREELRSVFGIKDSLLEQLQPFLRVNENTLQRLPLNRSSAYQIESKTGIPPQIAKQIVKWRQENGWFSAIEELQQVPGFQVEWMQKFRSLFYIE